MFISKEDFFANFFKKKSFNERNYYLVEKNYKHFGYKIK